MEAMTAKRLRPGEGPVLQLLGEPRVLKVTPAENGGKYLQFETSTAPGKGAPAHFHHREDEAFYVLAGRYEFEVGRERFEAMPGAFAFVPRGVVHAFANTGREPARMLITVTPGFEHEEFFREAGELARQLGKQPDVSRLVPLALKYGWELAPSG